MSTDPATLRSFNQFLAEVEEGQLQSDLSQRVRDIVAALHDAAMNGRGKASAKLTVALAFKLEGGIIEVGAEYTAKLPKSARARSVFWATPENNLSRRNPKQAELALRDVSSAHSDIRSAT